MALSSSPDRSYGESAPSVAISAFDRRMGDIAAHLAGIGVVAHVFGGAVRDALLGTLSGDFDLTLDVTAPEIGPRLAEVLGGTYFDLDVRRGIGRVAVTGPEPLTVDLTGAVPGSGVDAHLRGRDFTVDALAVDLSRLAKGHAAVIDPTGGLDDLRSGVIRALSSTALEQDPIRLLRGPRIAAAGSFALEDQTAVWTRDRASLIARVSPERVRDELVKILAAPHVTTSLRTLDDLGLLTAVLPELEESRGVVQPAEHHYDVFDHLVETPGAVELVMGEPGDTAALSYVPRFDGMAQYFARPLADGASRSTLLRLACLLHDVAKPAAMTVEPSGRIRFFEHGPLGARVCRDVMERLRFSRKAIQHVSTMVEYHLRPGQAAAPGCPPSARAIYRYRRDLGDVSIDTLYLNMADYIAAKGPDMLGPGYDFTEWESHCGAVKLLLSGDDGQSTRSRLAVGLLNGNEIMTEFSLKPGPAVGELLELVEEATATGEIKSRSGALHLARAALESGRVTGGRKLT